MSKVNNAFLKKLKTEDKWRWGLLCISILIICCTDFWFDHTPAPFPFIYKLGRTFNNLSLAYMASLIFYWIVVLIPENRKKASTYDYIYKRTGNVIGDCEALLTELVNASGYNPADKKNLSKQDIESILTNLSPNGKAPLIMQRTQQGYIYATWIQYMFFQRGRSLDWINKIFGYMIYIESESNYVQFLTNVKDCHYFVLLNQISSSPINNTNLHFISQDLYDYYCGLKALKEYADLNFSKYSKGYTLAGLTYF